MRLTNEQRIEIVEFVRGESWPTQCCAQNVKTGFMANVLK